MNEIVYIASDGSGMTYDDFLLWISDICKNGPDWTFDELTGGEDEFFSKGAYWEFRSYYEIRKNEILCN